MPTTAAGQFLVKYLGICTILFLSAFPGLRSTCVDRQSKANQAQARLLDCKVYFKSWGLGRNNYNIWAIITHHK